MGERVRLIELGVDLRVAQAASPGRYIMLSVGEGSDPFLPRPLWIWRSGTDRVRVLVSKRGRGSCWLAARRPGDILSFYGPLGPELALPPRTSRLLLSGATEGLGVLLALAEHALARSVEVALAMPPVEAEPLLPALPADMELLPELSAESLVWADALYCAGPDAVLQHAQGVLRSSGSRLPAFGLSHAPLACGVGACYGCVVRTRGGRKLSCVDGPAFPLRDLVWT